MLLECILVKIAAECSITVDEDAIMFGYIMSLGCVKIATECGVSQQLQRTVLCLSLIHI